MIDLVCELAHFEDRWAVAVLIDMLEPPGGAPGNGLTVERHANSGVQ
jgi:hypothetical protein